MFGLMQARACSKQIVPRFRRLHYCGTCKTMGSLYGQKSRVLLNHDTVFLAELLSLLAGEEKRLTSWSQSYQSFNCLALPRSEQEMPLPLQYAATATIVLADHKLRDHVQDSGRTIWRWLSRRLSSTFQNASSRLRRWNFPLEKLEQTLAAQVQREQQVLAGQGWCSPEATLQWLAEPTAHATAAFFGHGAGLVSRADHSETMRRIGFLFGSIAYVVDAFQDQERDEERGEFNALRAVGGTRRNVEQHVGAAVAEISSLLTTLPISQDAVCVYVMRLRANLAPELPPSLPVMNPIAKTHRHGFSLSQRWREARELARAARRRWSAEQPVTAWAGPVFGIVTLLALLSPQQVREAHSVQECFGLGTNLMFWGSAFVPLALCGPSRRMPQYDPYGRPIPPRGAGPSCCRECCCCCELCSCELCACEMCACEECCGGNCCSC